MTMHGQPLVPGVGPFVGDAPEDRHAERVVGEMLEVSPGAEEAGAAAPRLDEAMGRRIGGSPKAQARFLDRIEGVRGSPAVIEVTASPGKRCRFFGFYRDREGRPEPAGPRLPFASGECRQRASGSFIAWRREPPRLIPAGICHRGILCSIPCKEFPKHWSRFSTLDRPPWRAICDDPAPAKHRRAR